MQIDDQWNLVITVNDTVRIFHVPISKAVFEANFRILSATKADIFGNGNQYAFLSGLNVAALTLKDVGRRLAKQFNEDEGSDSGAAALLAELRRCSTVLVPSATGYEILPLSSALSAKAISAEDWEDAENQLVFFTSAVWLTPRKTRREAAKVLADIMSCSLTSSNAEEYASGLRTSAPANAPGTPALSVPT